MKAALYDAVKTIRLVDRPDPKAGPGEAVVKIELCGICGSDLHIYFGGTLPPGIVLGHENVGTVYELGDGVEGFRVGDRVVAGPPGSCGRCYQCLDYLSTGRFTTDGMLSDIIPLVEVVERGFERLAADRTLVKVAVAP